MTDRSIASGLSARALEWSRDQLEIAPDDSPGAARSGLLTVVEDAEFVPHETQAAACNILIDHLAPRPSAGLPPAMLREEEQRLQQEVDRLARRFFSCDPADRRDRWRRLSTECAPFPRLAARLAALEHGLSVQPIEVADDEPMMQQLAEHVQALFGRAPLDRAERRGRIIAEMEVSKWAVAARAFKRKYPELAALAPDLVDRLAVGDQPAPVRRKVDTITARRRGAAAASSDSGGWWKVALVVVIASGFIRFLIKTSDDPAPPYRPSSPTYRVPYGDLDNDFRSDELNEILERIKQSHAERLTPPDLFAPAEGVDPDESQAAYERPAAAAADRPGRDRRDPGRRSMGGTAPRLRAGP